MDKKLKDEARRVGRDVASDVANEGVGAFMRWLAKRPRIARFLVKLGMKR